jgi:hypothetical protein
MLIGVALFYGCIAEVLARRRHHPWLEGVKLALFPYLRDELPDTLHQPLPAPDNHMKLR